MQVLLLLLVLCLPAAANVVRQPSDDGGVSCARRPCTFVVNCARGCDSHDIQAALNEAWLGDTIELEAGRTWDISKTLTLYRKTQGEGFLTIRTSTPDDLLPAEDTRITPKYVPLMPTLRGIASQTRIIEVEQTTNAVENYRFFGLHLTTSDQVDVNDLVRLWAAGIHKDPSFTPNNIIFDRCILRGHPLRSAARGIRMGVRNGVIRNSFFDEFKAQVDSQTISNFNGPGPLLVQNNYLSAAGENFMTGGAIPDIQGLVPRDHVLEYNAFVKDPAQLLREPWGQGMYVRRGKIITSGKGYYKALDSGVTGQDMPIFPVTTINTSPGTRLAAGFVRTIEYSCPPELCVNDNGIRWQLVHVAATEWKPEMAVREGDLISYRGPETGNNTVNYYAAREGVTGRTPPFTWPMLPFNPSPRSCAPEFCVSDGTTAWQRYDGAQIPWWVSKNLLEFKVIDGARVRWNFFSGSWTDGQTGWGINLKPENQDPANTWVARTENIDFSYNVITNVERPFNWQGKSGSGTGIANNWRFHNNLFYNLRRSTGSSIVSGDEANGIEFTHNTLLLGQGTNLLGPAGARKDRIVITDNILQRGVAGIKRGGIAEGTVSLAESYTSFVFTNNIVEGLPTALYPAGNFNISLQQLGFLDMDNGDFRVRRCSSDGNDCSALKQLRSTLLGDKSIGADPELLPQARGLRVSATDRAALFTWELTEPIAHIPCVVEISTDRDLSTTIPDLDPSWFARPDTDRHDEHMVRNTFRMLRIGKNSPLIPDTTYWYRLHCGGDLKTGSFRTSSPVTGTTEMHLERPEDPVPDTALAIVEYGKHYSRQHDHISDGVLSEAARCSGEGKCKIKVPAERGSILYYRFYDIAADGTLLRTQPVSVTTVE